MSTDQLPAPVNTITEADVAHMLEAAQAKLPDYCMVSVTRSKTVTVFLVSGQTEPDYKWISGSGETIAEAHAKFLANLPPQGAALAAQKRAEAAKLNAKANAILATVVPVPVIQDREGCGV